ncbi:MAG: hypothetical protein MHMPM18_002315 [Marteilia pararefringens]
MVILVIYYVGMLKETHRHAKIFGFSVYIRNVRNSFDFALLFIYTTVIIALIASLFNIWINERYSKLLERHLWPKMHPLLILQSSVALLILFTHLRLLFFLQSHRVLGPIQSSLANACVDILRLILLFFFVLFVFTVALQGLFRPYSAENIDQIEIKTSDSSFDNFTNTFRTLFWAIFGISTNKETILKVKTESGINETSDAVSLTGAILFSCYHIVTVVLLLNLLIAIMTDTYQRTVVLISFFISARLSRTIRRKNGMHSE